MERAAVEGLRPIAEMQFSDFVSCGFDQLVNVAGKTYYRMGLSVNITAVSYTHLTLPTILLV